MISETTIIPSVTARLFLLGTMSLVLSPHLLRLPLMISVVAVLMIIWRLGYELKDWPLPGKVLKALLTIAASLLILNQFHTLFGQEPGVALLTLLLALKLIEIRTLRDAMITIFIAYFLVATTFLFSQSIFIGIYLFTVALLLMSTLIALNHPETSTANIKYYFRHSGVMIIQSIPIMLALFILFPRFNAPLWGLTDKNQTATTGLSDEMTMGNITDLVDSEEIAFRVNFKDDIPPANFLYWRAMVFWKTDGSRWTQLSYDSHLLNSHRFNKMRWLSEPTSYTIIFEPHQQTALVALDLPSIQPIRIDRRYTLYPDFQIELKHKLTSRIEYSLESYIDYRQTELNGWEFYEGLDLPEDKNQQTYQLAMKMRFKADSDYDYVQAVLNYFRTEPFYYTRQPPALGGDVVDQFMFESRQGFCEHYAASFVTMMRAANIPARVVVGYQGGELNPVGNYLIVRQSDAHAWAEVWLDEQGWVRVDPTSVIPLERVISNQDDRRFETIERRVGSGISFITKAFIKIQNQWDAINHQWNQWVVGFNQQRQQELINKLGLNNFRWSWSIALVVSLILPILLILIYNNYRDRNRVDPLLKHYQRFCNKLAKKGIAIKPSESPQSIANRVSKQLPHLQDSIKRITQLYHHLRYGGLNNTIQHKLFIKEINRFKP